MALRSDIRVGMSHCAPPVQAFTAGAASRLSIRRHAHQELYGRQNVEHKMFGSDKHPGNRRTTGGNAFCGALNSISGSDGAVFASSNEPSIQLATAKLPKQIDEAKFADKMYQWAATLTSSGQNMPFSLPLRIRKLPGGFEMSLLRISNGEPVAVAHIRAEVEDEPSVGNVFFVRFFEGPGSQLVRSSKLPDDPQRRLKLIIDGIVDISTIMRTMQAAIKETAGRSVKSQQ